MNPLFSQAKDYILEGLSYRLNSYEHVENKESKINMKPRKNYGPEMEKQIIDNYAQNKNK